MTTPFDISNITFKGKFCPISAIKMNLKLNNRLRLFTVLFFFAVFFFSFYNVQSVSAQTCGGATAGSCPSGQACSCNQTNYDNCRDLGTNCTPEEINCHCENDPADQEACYHTICPVGYSCVGSGPSSYCEKITSGGGGSCSWSQVNCPPDWTRGGEVISVSCGTTYCPQPGTAQVNTGCCGDGKYDENGEWFCGNGQITTYNCCPPGSPWTCSTTQGGIITVLNQPSNPQNCGEDVYISHANTNQVYRTYKYCDGYENVETNKCDGEIISVTEYYVQTTCQDMVTTCKCAPPQTPTTSPTPTPITSAQCNDVKAYTTNWLAHSLGTLSQLKAKDQVYFCARGSTNLGTFDKAQFTINGNLRPETAVARPETTNEFCDFYTIPENVYSFNIQARVNHTTLGWVQ